MPADERTQRLDVTVDVRLSAPPVRQSTVVRSDVDHVFDAFVRTIAAWWPLQPMSIGRARVRSVTVEEHVGGVVYETWDDGTTVEWGRVTVWSPPDRLVLSWVTTPEPTEVELTFTALGPGMTRVAVEHRGWERLDEAQLREDCAAPGGYRSGAYSTGWAHVLTLFAAAIDRDDPTRHHQEAPA